MLRWLPHRGDAFAAGTSNRGPNPEIRTSDAHPGAQGARRSAAQSAPATNAGIRALHAADGNADRYSNRVMGWPLSPIRTTTIFSGLLLLVFFCPCQYAGLPASE